MTTDPFTTAARAEAMSAWNDPEAPSGSIGELGVHMAVWARDHLAAQEPTDAATGHAYAEWMNHSPIRDLDVRRLNCTCGERGLTSYGFEHHRLRAALTAAKEAADEDFYDGDMDMPVRGYAELYYRADQIEKEYTDG